MSRETAVSVTASVPAASGDSRAYHEAREARASAHDVIASLTRACLLTLPNYCQPHTELSNYLDNTFSALIVRARTCN